MAGLSPTPKTRKRVFRSPKMQAVIDAQPPRDRLGPALVHAFSLSAARMAQEIADLEKRQAAVGEEEAADDGKGPGQGPGQG